MDKIGKWVFIVGLVIAVLGGLGIEQPWFLWVLALLGLITGFLNVTGEETKGFLLAAIGLIVSAGAIQSIPYIGDTATRIIDYLVAFISAAVLIVALKALFETAKD